MYSGIDGELTQMGLTTNVAIIYRAKTRIEDTKLKGSFVGQAIYTVEDSPISVPPILLKVDGQFQATINN